MSRTGCFSHTTAIFWSYAISVVLLIGSAACNVSDDGATPDQDASTEDAGEDCDPEGDRQLCERLGTECGFVVAEDNCGLPRDVDCGQFDDFVCGDNADCQSTDAPGVNQCECDDGFERQGSTCEATDTEAECQGVENNCSVHVLEEGSLSYRETDFAETELADDLDGPVVAGFDLEETERAYLLTESSYYRIDTTGFDVVESGAHADIHPDLGAASELTAAFSIPERVDDAVDEGEGNDDVVFVRNPDDSDQGESLSLHYDFSSHTFQELDDFAGWEPVVWDQEQNTELIPEVTDSYLAMWLDDNNQRGFLSGDIGEACDGSEQPTEGVPYQAVLTSENLHFAAATACFPFIKKEPVESAVPFAELDHAITFEDLGAAFWHRGSLYLFTAGFYE